MPRFQSLLLVVVHWDSPVPEHRETAKPLGSSEYTRGPAVYPGADDDGPSPSRWHQCAVLWTLFKDNPEFLDLQDSLRDHEIDDQPGGIDECGNERVREHSGIHFDGACKQRHRPADRRGHGTHGQQRQPNDEPDLEL